MLSGDEAARAAVLQVNLHLTLEDEHPLRLRRAVELARESDRAFAQLVARGGQQGRKARLVRALVERHALFAEFRPTVVIRVQHDLRELFLSVHSLLPYGDTQPTEVSMKLTALAAALALALSSALIAGCDRDGGKSASGGGTSPSGSSSPSGASGTSGSSSGSSSSTAKKPTGSPSGSPSGTGSSGTTK